MSIFISHVYGETGDTNEDDRENKYQQAFAFLTS
jgi:hypothetical protein